MKTNTKIVDLIYEGFSTELVKNLTEKQIDVLHSKLMEGKKKSETKEQAKPTTTTKQVQITTVPPGTSYATKSGEMVKNTSGAPIQVTTGEGEMKEDQDIDLTVDPDKSADGMGMFEASKDVKYQEKKNDKLIFGGEKKESKDKKTDVIKRKIKKGLSDKVSKTKTMGLPIGG